MINGDRYHVCSKTENQICIVANRMEGSIFEKGLVPYSW